MTERMRIAEMIMLQQAKLRGQEQLGYKVQDQVMNSVQVVAPGYISLARLMNFADREPTLSD